MVINMYLLLSGINKIVSYHRQVKYVIKICNPVVMEVHRIALPMTEISFTNNLKQILFLDSKNKYPPYSQISISI